MSRILVVGASGTVGTELVKILRSRGHDVRRASSQKNLASDQAHLNLLTGEGLEAAVNGVDKIFLLSPPGYANQDELLNPVIDQAAASGIKKIVLMTAMGANASSEAPLRKAELRLEKSGVPYNIIRPNWFMQNFNTFWLHGILSAGKIFLPVEKAKGSFIDARDIAAVAAELLDSDKFDNKDFDLTGSMALDHDEVAAILSRVTGQKIIYENISSSEMRENLLSAGLPTPYTEFLLMILDFFRQGYAERTTDVVEKITGRKPRSFENYAQDYKHTWIK